MAADPHPRVRGLLESTIFFKEKVVLSADLWIGLLAGGATYIWAPDASLGTALSGLTSAGISVAAALVGVVIAALAVLVAFLDDDFLGLMDEATQRYGAIEGQLFPFWFVTGLGAVVILLSLGAIAFANDAEPLMRRILVAVLVFLLVWLTLGVVNLVGYLQATGVSRAILIRARRRR